MEPWHSEEQAEIVEAIEEGKIVRVRESYAKKEGLLIIRKQIIRKDAPRKKDEEEARLYFEDFRKPLSWKKNQVAAELLDNFQWEISRKRKERGMTRRQLAKSISETENNIKMLENGILPKNDFVIINKVQSFLNINLRKDKKDFSTPARSLLDDKKPKENQEDLSGKDIEITD